MQIILLCGGSGQRLWPLSNPIRSKMFLELLPSPDGGIESMIGRVCRQLFQQGLGESALFITHQYQTGLTKRYTNNCIPVIGEPWKRGTFTAAALGTLFLHYQGKLKSDETICVAPADMYADDDFFGHFHAFPDILKDSQADIALLGTRPTYPSDQYGYILSGSGNSTVYTPVIGFQEKPEIAQAEKLIQQQALWNCGVFAFSVQFMLTYLEQMGLPTDYNNFLALYPHLPVRSFDKEVVEHTSKLVVTRHDGEWRDLGSWESLTGKLPCSVIGEGGIWGETTNTHVINELKVPLYVIGVSDIVAIASPDGILVAQKDQANEIKEIVASPSNPPLYGETQWGSYSILDVTEDVEASVSTAITLKLTILPNHSTHEHCCEHLYKIWTIVSGRGEVMLDHTVQPAAAGDVFTIPRGVCHEIRAFTAMNWIEVRKGKGILDETIYVG